MMIPFFDRISKREQKKPVVDIAELISLLFDPFGTTLLTSLILIVTSNIILTQTKLTIVSFLLLALAVPAAYLVYGLKTGKIKDIFISDRRERYNLLIIASVVATLFTAILWYFSAPKLILAYSTAALVLALVMTIVTFFWKISGHTSVLTLNLLTLLFVWQYNHLWLVILLPIVAWARIKLKVHTLEQVVAGTVVSTMIFFWVFGWFELIQLY